MPEDRATLDMVVARLEDLREDVREVRTDLHSLQSTFVSTPTWQARNSEVNVRLDALGTDIGNLRTEVRAARAPWWTWATVLCGVGGLVIAVFVP